MSDGKAVHISAANWKSEVLESSIPVLVDFWAQWCGPCKMIAPVLEELATQYDGRIKVAKVDVDESPDLAGEFGIRSIPTLLILKQGVVQEQMVGAVAKAVLERKLAAYL